MQGFDAIQLTPVELGLSGCGETSSAYQNFDGQHVWTTQGCFIWLSRRVVHRGDSSI